MVARETEEGVIKDTHVYDRVSRNPYLHFVISEFWAAFASLSVWILFYTASFLVETISAKFPLASADPIIFLTLVLNWGGVLFAGCGFVIISIYQLFVLFIRLRENMANAD